MRSWNAGSIVGRPLEVMWPILPFFAVALVLAFAVSGPLNAMALGDELAVAQGVRLVRTRVLAIIALTLLAGGATAIAGPIGFVGLMVPHVARWIVGPHQRWIFAYSVLLAPSLLLASDILGRVVMRPGEIPVGHRHRLRRRPRPHRAGAPEEGERTVSTRRRLTSARTRSTAGRRGERVDFGRRVLTVAALAGRACGSICVRSSSALVLALAVAVHGGARADDRLVPAQPRAGGLRADRRARPGWCATSWSSGGCRGWPRRWCSVPRWG